MAVNKQIYLLLGLFSMSLSLSSPLYESFNVRLSAPMSKRECGIVPKLKIRQADQDQVNQILTHFGEVPWQVSIFHQDIFICSGTLISSIHVVTAAFCMLAIESASDIEIRLGEWDISSTNSPHEMYDHFSTSVKEVLMHPENSIVDKETSRMPTIALLTLQNEVDFIRFPHVAPLCLPPILPMSPQNNVGDSCYISGWGLQNSTDQFIDSGSNHKSRRNQRGEGYYQSSPSSSTHIPNSPILLTFPLVYEWENKSKQQNVVSMTSDPITNLSVTVSQSVVYPPDTLASHNHQLDSDYASSANTNGNLEPSTLSASLDKDDLKLKNGQKVPLVEILHPRDPVEEYMDIPEETLSDYQDEDKGDGTAENDNTGLRESAHSSLEKGSSTVSSQEEDLLDKTVSKHMDAKPETAQSYSSYGNRNTHADTWLQYDRPKQYVLATIQSLNIEPYEAILYRHKQKYKIGKLAASKKNSSSKLNPSHHHHNNRERKLRKHHDNTDIFLDFPSVNTISKRSTVDSEFFYHKNTDIQTERRATDLKSQGRTKISKSTSILKYIAVEFHSKCQDGTNMTISDPFNYNYKNDHMSPATTACISAVNEKISPLSLCMIDIGSPVVCSPTWDKLKRTSIPGRRNSRILGKHLIHSKTILVSNEKNEDVDRVHGRTHSNSKKAYLAGVITWKIPCVGTLNVGRLRANHYFKMVTNVQEFLPFLLQNMRQ